MSGTFAGGSGGCLRWSDPPQQINISMPSGGGRSSGGGGQRRDPHCSYSRTGHQCYWPATGGGDNSAYNEAVQRRNEMLAKLKRDNESRASYAQINATGIQLAALENMMMPFLNKKNLSYTDTPEFKKKWADMKKSLNESLLWAAKRDKNIVAMVDQSQAALAGRPVEKRTPPTQPAPGTVAPGAAPSVPASKDLAKRFDPTVGQAAQDAAASAGAADQGGTPDGGAGSIKGVALPDKSGRGSHGERLDKNKITAEEYDRMAVEDKSMQEAKAKSDALFDKRDVSIKKCTSVTGESIACDITGDAPKAPTAPTVAVPTASGTGSGTGAGSGNGSGTGAGSGTGGLGGLGNNNIGGGHSSATVDNTKNNWKKPDNTPAPPPPPAQERVVLARLPAPQSPAPMPPPRVELPPAARPEPKPAPKEEPKEEWRSPPIVEDLRQLERDFPQQAATRRKGGPGAVGGPSAGGQPDAPSQSGDIGGIFGDLPPVDASIPLPEADVLELGRAICPMGEVLESEGDLKGSVAAYRDCLFPDGKERKSLDEQWGLYLAIVKVAPKVTPRLAASKKAEAAVKGQEKSLEKEELEKNLHDSLFSAPWWADAHYAAGRTYGKLSDDAKSRMFYKIFLKAAAKGDARLEEVRAKLKEAKKKG